MEKIRFFTPPSVPQSPDSYKHLADLHRLLKEYSGRDFPVAVRELSNPGLAVGGNMILIDQRVLKYPREVIGFVLAHEWGHQIHGDVAKYLGATKEFIDGREDEADAYAARFFAFMGYSLSGVYEFNKILNPHTAALRDIKIQKAYFEELEKLLASEETADNNFAVAV